MAPDIEAATKLLQEEKVRYFVQQLRHNSQTLKLEAWSYNLNLEQCFCDWIQKETVQTQRLNTEYRNKQYKYKD